jgi:hypothetical protein
LDDTINATSTYLGAIAKSPATSVKKVLESDYNNNASISITSDPFTSNTLLPILYLGVISSDGKYISEAKANKTSLVTINRINNNETKSIINKTVLAMIPTKDRIFDSFNNDYNFPINSNLAL